MTAIIKGKLRKPLSMIVYGPPGMGKTTFASGADSPVAIATDEVDEYDTPRFPTCKTFDQILKYTDELISGVHKKENFKTVIFDVVDGIEKLIHKEIIAKEPGKTMETACSGYGKAYALAYTRLDFFKKKLETLRDNCGFNIILLFHAKKVKFNDPILMLAYDKWELPLHGDPDGKKKSTDANALFMDWVSTCFFINGKNFKDDEAGRYALSTGGRQLFTEFRPSHVAKNRFNLPYTIDLISDRERFKENFKIVESMINQFYASGGKVDEQKQKELYWNQLHHDIRGLFSKVKTRTDYFNIIPLIEQSIEESSNSIEQLEGIKNRLSDLLAK